MMREAKREHGKSHVDITAAMGQRFPSNAKAKTCAGHLYRAQVPGHFEGSFLLTACGAVRPREQETLLCGGGSTDLRQGKGRKGNACADSRVKLKGKNPSPEPKQLHKPTRSSLRPLTHELPTAGRRWREGSAGKGVPFHHFISRKCSKGGDCLSLTGSSTGKSTGVQGACMNSHPTC